MNAPKCPGCHKSEGTKQVDGQRAVCRSCSEAKRRVFNFCCACEREWARDASIANCSLPNCALRAALLSDKQIDDPRSSAKGCPYFRACPGCKTLLTHNGVGCPKINCPKCGTEFCFRCLNKLCFGINDLTFLRLQRGLSLFQDNSINPCRVVNNTQMLAVLGL
ncbi:E3 ubiquitin-protein ligase ARIH2-like [Triplophysa rosa]|uniref:RBR-type E3 ubiquitin transferase n=1 Tax=Triplophysa rosa TaxID=992332 RepID=A0A9W8CB38_TRIRA|nr:E3 ubiquitin-protein ligase ARIH2-like [Triplophysa rosa]XP_057179664.1 E3 ubiquitin-protein ligase ARIH2-like [Triplophysa rosa]XP_057179674.1 E3 ubiquitin-protein ligase ARIH2-like [Triplophysa rosa]KAI7812984.1 hypothetical protein IRJ41_013195 [Triplophysa rosa]